MVRYGIVGAGMMVAEHIRNIALVDDDEVTAIVDPRAPSMARAGGIGHAGGSGGGVRR